MERIKTAVIGCGNLADLMIPNMKDRFTILDVYACCDLNRTRGEHTAEKYGLQFMTQEEIAADPTIELVVNLTPPKAHFGVISAMLRAGKHVYSEKVLALSLDEAKVLCDLAEEMGVCLCVAPDTLLGAQIQNARQLIDSQMIGAVTSCCAELGRDHRMMSQFIPYLDQRGGDIGIDSAVYYVSTLVYLLGPVKKVCGFNRLNFPERTNSYPELPGFGEVRAVETKTVTAACLEFECGTLATMLFDADTIMPESPRLVLRGTKGMMSIDNPDNFAGDVAIIRNGQFGKTVIPSTFGATENARGIGVAEMAWSIRKNRTPILDQKFAYHVLEVLLRIEESADTGMACRICSTVERGRALTEGFFSIPQMDSWEAGIV